MLRCQEDSAEELIRQLRNLFCVYGVPEELASDGASVFLSSKTKAFLALWGVRHRVSSAYHPQSNLHAETCVKSMKRLIASNTGAGGTLDTDALTAALLQYRNTPDRDTGLSPAQVLYARQLRDVVPCEPERLKLRPEWVLTLERREAALAKRHQVRGVELSKGNKVQVPLTAGQAVQVQNQRGPHSNKWDLSGTVIEVVGHDSYTVKMDGSGRVTHRNRQFLKPIRGYMELLRESDRKRMRSNPNAAGSDRDGASAGGGVQRDTPAPIKPYGQLEPSSYVHAGPGRSSAGDRAVERLTDSGPRNTCQEKSSSQPGFVQIGPGGSVAGERAMEHLTSGGTRNIYQVQPSIQYDDVQVQPQVQVSAQPKPVQPQSSDTSSPVITDYVLGHNVRPVWARQAPQRLVVGNPSDPRFNRTRGQ